MKNGNFLLLLLIYSCFSWGECKFVYPTMPYSSVKEIYNEATDSERKRISSISKSSVSLVFTLLSGKRLIDDKLHNNAISYARNNWKNDNLLAEYFYFSGTGEVSHTSLLQHAADKKIESIILSEALKITSPNSVEAEHIRILEPAVLSLISQPNSTAYLAKAIIEKEKYPKNPIGYGLSALMAVRYGQIQGLPYLSNFYIASDCAYLSEFTDALWSVGSRIKPTN